MNKLLAAATIAAPAVAPATRRTTPETPSRDTTKSGCGCGTNGADAGVMLGMLGFAVGVRRRRRSHR